MKINTSRKAGFTLVEIMIVVAIIGLLAAIAIPNFVRARQTSQTNACINNLRQIDGAVNQLALENKLKSGDPATVASLTVYVGRGTAGTWPTGPLGEVYPDQVVGTAPVCPPAWFNAATHNAILP